jgi:hypothetical protein
MSARKTAKILGVMMLFCASAVAPGVAHAGAIANLTEQPQTVEIKTGGGYEPQQIAPGAVFRLSYPARIRFHEKEFYLEKNVEYAIWPDGAFGPQRKFGNNRGLQ